jgi:hypothetical protein
METAILQLANNDFGSMSIADHDMDHEHLTLWLEDVRFPKASIDDCLRIEIPLNQVENFIKAEKLNVCEVRKMHEEKEFVFSTEVEIAEPLDWYNLDASASEQRMVREALFRGLFESAKDKLINY